MSKVTFSGDLHWNHKLGSELRGFKSVEEHNQYVLDAHNSVVNKRDTCYILGDLAFGEKDYSFLDKFNGEKVIILGNHENKHSWKALMPHVKLVQACVKHKGYWITHIPVHPIEFAHRVKGNIHAHLHEKTIEDERYYCVSLEQLKDFKPKTLEEILS